MVSQGEKHINNIRKKVGRIIYKNGLIKEGDKILLGLSGGKDSMILLECLADRRKYLPFKFDIIAVHVNITTLPYAVDVDALKDFCDELNVEFRYVEESVELDPVKVKEKSPCFICSWNRRKILFRLAREYGCNKLALGHHQDDALETLFMNMIYHSSISSMPQKLKMFEGDLTLIRPLLDLNEESLIKYAESRNFPEEIKQCSFGHNTGRNNMKDFLHMLEKVSPNAKRSIYKAMDNIHKEYLPKTRQV